jgi:phage terminase large subunit-like protein
MALGLKDLNITPHPVLPAPDDGMVAALLAQPGGEEKLANYLVDREGQIQRERDDPFSFGWEPDNWADADKLLADYDEVLINGGNRAGKSEYAAKRVVQLAERIPNARIWCIHTTSMSSVEMQHPLVWKYLPLSWKAAKKSRVTNILYSQKNGFGRGSNKFVAPNGSQVTFLNFAQEKRVIEGGEVDMVWIDEGFDELDWIETLRYRLITRRGLGDGRGKLLMTFTPITGFSPVCREYLAGFETLESRASELLPGQNVKGCKMGEMPYIAKSGRGNSAVMWFHTVMNPYQDWMSMVKQLKGRPKQEIKIRAYGFADDATTTQFPQFKSHNIIAHDKIPEGGSNYYATDPGGQKNWFMLWLKIDEHGRRYIYREFPSANCGEWAVPGPGDGKRGLAQTQDVILGIADIVEHIKTLEGKEAIEERYIDPRMGATQAAGKHGGTSYIDLLADEGMDVLPAAGLRIEQGVGMINDWLAYDEDRPISIDNEPSLYVSDKCENLIYCLRTWGNREKDGATKDPIDTLRYMAVMNPVYMDPKGEKVYGGGTY